MIDRDLYNRLRKRMLMFYFAAGINFVMAIWVVSVAGGSSVSGGTVWLVVLIFLAFAALNFYMARVLRRQWDAHLRQQQPPPADDTAK